MPSQNETRNQHFYSQAEQRLNASDPPTNRRIYSFRLKDREAFSLESPVEVAIKKNLSFGDLYSIHVDGKLRTNLENAFQRFEQRIQQYTTDLIDALRARDDSRLKQPLIEVYAAKNANWARNPHSVRKVLNTYSGLEGYESLDPEFQGAYQAFLTGARPQMPDVCERFKLTEDEYERWLRTLVKLHLPADLGRAPLLELVNKLLLETHYVLVSVHEYSPGTDACLLSDRSVVFVEKEAFLVLECNLHSHAFASFTLVDLSKAIPAEVRRYMTPEVDGQFRAHVHVSHDLDNLDALRFYNSRVVYQCAERVFSASSRVPALGGGASSS